MFWGLIMEPKRRYWQKVMRPFHVSMASLDIHSSTDEPSQVMVTFQERNYLVCTLDKTSHLQVPLDLNFEIGDEVSFAVNGNSHVHLTGYHNEEFEDGLDDEELGEEESDADEEQENVSMSNVVSGKRKSVPLTGPNPKRKSTGLADAIEAQWDSFQFGSAAKKSKTIQLLEGINSQDEDDDSDDADVTFSDLDEEEDEGEGDTTMDDIDDEDVDDEDESNEEEEDSDDDDDVKLEVDSDAAVEEEEEEQVAVVPTKKLKKKKEKAEAEPEPKKEQPQQNGLSPKSPKKRKRKNKQENKLENGTTPAKDAIKLKSEVATPKSEKKQQSASPAPKKYTDRGVQIEDLVVGSGAPAKNGKFVQVYYEGRLKTNNKMFDSALKGTPFKFRLGKSEVIKGWDVGLFGMKVGGKRRITCPPQLAYGKTGAPPKIPPNSTLVFDVELKNVN